MFKKTLLAAAVLTLAGCQAQTAVDRGDEFTPDNQPKDINRLVDAQVQRGAVADATLYACHFDGAKLNSLGTAKLDLMLKNSDGSTLTVWMAVPDDTAQMRRVSVAAYLQGRGVAPEQVTFNRGANPDTDHPAAQSLKDLPKTDSTDSNSAAASSLGGVTQGGSPAATPGAGLGQ